MYERRRDDETQQERAEEKQVYQLRKNDGYEAVMCQVDRFFLLLTSFAKYILGDDDNAFVHCIKRAELRLCFKGSDSRRSYVKNRSQVSAVLRDFSIS